MADIVMIYSTFAARDEAISAARALLERRLIACANLIGNATSLYRWEGKLHEENECVLIAKTTVAKQEEALAALKALHSYELPCILAYPAEGGFVPYMQWVSDEVAD